MYGRAMITREKPREETAEKGYINISTVLLENIVKLQVKIRVHN